MTMRFQFFTIDLKCHIELFLFLVELLKSFDEFFTAIVINDLAKFTFDAEHCIQIQVLQARAKIHDLSRLHERWQISLTNFD